MGLERRLEQMRAKLAQLTQRCRMLRQHRKRVNKEIATEIAECLGMKAEYKRLIQEFSRRKGDRETT